MTAAEFKNGIMDWLKKNEIEENVDTIIFNAHSYFDWESNIVALGVYDEGDVINWFEEFLVDHGLEWTGILPPVLALLHEVGHSKTVYSLDETQRFICHVLKDLLGPTDGSKEAAFDYWNVQDEADANNWVVEFVNNHADAVVELHQYFIANWDDCLGEMTAEVEQMAI